MSFAVRARERENNFQTAEETFKHLWIKVSHHSTSKSAESDSIYSKYLHGDIIKTIEKEGEEEKDVEVEVKSFFPETEYYCIIFLQ